MLKTNVQKAHAKLSASGADKWLNCSGSIQAEEAYPNGNSEFAEEGTIAHEVGDQCLKMGVDAETFFGVTLKKLGIKDIKSFLPTYQIEHDMVNHVQEYIDYVRSFETTNTVLYTEERVDFSNVVADGFGTMDSGVLDYDTGIFHIFDLKYGKGIPVYAVENNQAKMYAIGLLNELGFLGAIKSFRIHIAQPRLYNFSSWDITVEDLTKFAKYAKERAELALTKDAPRTPGTKQCQWCRAKGDCAALYKFTEEAIMMEFEDMDDEENFPDAQTLTYDQKKLILDNRKLIESFLKTVEANVFTQLCDGEKFEGYKIVEGRANRILIEGAEKLIVSQLGEDAYNKKLIGLGDLEKKLSKKEVAKLTIKPQGKLTLAPEHDKRPAVTPDEDAEFDDIGEDYDCE